MKFQFNGIGKYFVSGLDGKGHKAIVGELVELTAKQFTTFRDRFEIPAETFALTAAETVEAERLAEEARVMAELEAEQVRLAEELRVKAETEAINASIATEQAVAQAENVAAVEQTGFSL